MAHLIPDSHTLMLKGFHPRSTYTTILAFVKEATPNLSGLNISCGPKKQVNVAFVHYDSPEAAVIAKTKLDAFIDLAKIKTHPIKPDNLVVELKQPPARARRETSIRTYWRQGSDRGWGRVCPICHVVECPLYFGT